jgi:hypothetical protein
MEQLKKIAQLGRQHYEKLILILVLVLLALGVLYLYQASQDEAEKTRQMAKSYITKAGAPVEPVSLDRFAATMKATTNPPTVNFSGKHNLFNPVKWQQPRGGGAIIKVQTGKEVGVEALRIVNISPLYLSIDFLRAASSGSDADLVVTGYHVVATNELVAVASRRRVQQFIGTGSTNSQLFVLTGVKGPSNNPTEFTAQLRDYDNDPITFAPGKPYTRVVGHEAELAYPLTGRKYPRLRKDSPIDIEGEPYKVVDITATKVVVSDDSNGKRYTIEERVAP